jgi:hypothetical protein
VESATGEGKIMKAIRTIIALALLSMLGVGSAWADHRGHGHFGVFIGPAWGPLYYPSPYYYPPPYYPPVIVERPLPPVYIEQAPPPPPPVVSAEPAPIAYWYYCAASAAYYPYVKQCPGGWQKVLPQPPGQ